MEQTSSGQPFYLNDTDTVTVEQLKTSDLRSLGDNVKLLAVIQNLSQDLVTKSENTYKKLDEIQCETEIKSVGVKNLINEFQMLADSQFIENRIYDADQIDSPPDNPTKSCIEEENNKTPPDQKILPLIHECISNSLKFIDENFNLGDKQLKQAESDDEEDYVKETLARAMESNSFNKTPLPAIIGSHAFFNQSIFNDGEHPVPISQNDNQSELSSDKNSIASDESDEDSDLLFSSNKQTISIKPGIIPPPPPMPNFKSLPDKNDDDDDETLFPTSQPTVVKPQVLPQLPQLPPFPRSKQFAESDDEDDNDLFSAEKTVPSQIKPKIPPRIVPQIPALPKLKPVENSDEDDDDDDDLFTHSNNNAAPEAQPKAIKVLPSSPPQLKPMVDNTSDDEDSDDLFKPPKVKPRNSIASLQETLKPSSATIETTKKPPEKKPNVWDLESDDDDEDDEDEKLFPINKSKVVLPRVLPQLPPFPKRKPFDGSDDEDDDNLFSTKKIVPAPPQIKPQIPTRTLPDNPPLPILKPVEKKESDDEDDNDLFVTEKSISGPPQIKPQVAPRTIPRIPELPKLKPIETSDEDDDDDDDNDDLFSINNSKLITQPKVNEPLPSSPSLKIKENKSDAGDTDDLFKPPKVKPRNSINSAPKTQETPKPSSTTIDPPKRPPEIKSNNIWDLDSDDDDEALFPINKTLNNKPQVIKPQIPLQHEPLEESDDDNESLFSSKETVSVQSRSLPQTPPLAVHKPAEKSNENDEDEDDLFVTEKPITVSPQIKPKIAPRTIPQISDLPVLKPVENSDNDDDDDDDDDLFAHNKKSTVPTIQPRMIKVLPSSSPLKPMIDNNSDDEDSDDLFKPPKVKPRSSIASLQEKVKPSSATIDSSKRKPEAKPDIWDLDSDDDDLFKTVK